MERKKLMNSYKCSSSGPQNNGLLKKCNFEGQFEPFYTYNCPLCASRLEYICKGKSVSDLLREGMERCGG